MKSTRYIDCRREKIHMKEHRMIGNIYEFSAVLNNGEETRLTAYKGKVLLIVNTASKCGFTPQYEGLQRLYERYGSRGFEILAFPCDQFAHQEPDNDEAIHAFCKRNFGISFLLFSKIEVNGNNAHPLFKYLRKCTGGLFGNRIAWNFTKFLVDKNGIPIRRFAPTVKPDDIAEAIEAEL